MNQRTLEVLEYPRIREEIAGFCMSAEGKEFLLSRAPSSEAETVKNLKTWGRAWLAALSAETPPSFTGWPPVRQSLSRLRVEGASFSVEELYALGLFCESAMKFRSWAENRARQAVSGRRDSLSGYGPEVAVISESTAIPGELSIIPEALLSSFNSAQRIPSADGNLLAAVLTLPDLSVPENAIFRIIDKNGEIRDLPELRAIRQGIQRIRQDIERLVGRYLSDDGLKSSLQSTLPTIRDGRQVIAVRASVRSRIRGIVHEVSQSGQTVYIEPEDVVDRNNDLVTEEHRLSREIARILREVTASLSPQYDDLVSALDSMVFLDGIGAGARWGRENRCVFAGDRLLSSDKAHSAALSAQRSSGEEPASLLQLRQARHPLLRAKAVPIDLVLIPGGRVLIITGPNTGGKTVSLKTAALFALLNQTGWPIPAAESTVLPVFDYIGCDIGDEQSLDQSLSTFSGHMKNIAGIIAHATEKSLVLLDELGSGTDPQEGSAIAMAVLDSLLAKKSVVLVTTHHGVLKNYGYTHASCINASVDFDENTLSPTYRILMGIPGESHALDIASRNGLDPAIVAQARTYLLEERADVSALISGLTAKHEELDRFEQEKKKEEEALRERRRKSDLKDLQLRQKELELREQGYRRLERLLDESRKQLENLVRELREGELTRDKTLEVKAWMADLETRVSAEYDGLASARSEADAARLEIEARQKSDDEEAARAGSGTSRGRGKGRGATGRDAVSGRGQAKPNTEYLPAFAPGVEVYIGKSKSRGTIVRAAKKDQWIVAAGTMKMTIPESGMSPVPVNGQEKRVSIDVQTDMGGDDTPTFELRLIGMRHDEAMKALARQLDLASLKGMKEFSIVHGKGEGILQTAVHEMLGNYAAVNEYHFARPEDGGTGKTIVMMG